MESSQKVPPKRMAVLCSLAELPDGSLRVILDDAHKGQEPGAWAYQSLVTFKDYAPGVLDDLAALPEAELANFGYYVLARLLASNGHGTQQLIQAEPASRVGLIQALGLMSDTSKPVQQTDPSHEAELGRNALWLDIEDLRWLATNCSCAETTPDSVKECCGRIRFRANAALHKAGLKTLPVNGSKV